MKAVLFDLDNTLVDRDASIKHYVDFFVTAFEKNLREGIATEMLQALFLRFDERGYAGHEVRSQRLINEEIWLTPPSVSEILAHWFDTFPYNPVAMQGLEVIDTLATDGYKLGLITNGKIKTQETKMHRLGILHKFDAVSISEAVGAKKPDNTIFQHCLDQLDIPKNEVCFVGDHIVNDYIGSMSFGLQPIWFQGAQPWNDDVSPQYAINHLSQLPDLLQRLKK